MWKVEYKKLLKELAYLPQDMKARIEPIIFQKLESENPFDLGYLQKMKNYDDKYKTRVGDYRIGISVDKETQTLICQRVAHRKDIYRTFT